MNYTENGGLYSPVEHHVSPLGASSAWQAQPQQRVPVKLEPVENRAVPSSTTTATRPAHSVDVPKRNEHAQGPTEQAMPLYTKFKSVHDIEYTPENALQEGTGMVNAIKEGIRRLELGSKMRKDVWLREVAGLQGQAAPTTLIAVCGATGAGKSSLLNAILDDNIVPTSGMRACTAVVTEIAYHNKPTVDADVSFLSLDEWKEELEVLLDDLIGEDGNVRRATDLRSEAGVAWHKVNAVYPNLSQDLLARMSADQIIAFDPTISSQLGTTKRICAKDSKVFALEISKFIDSKDRKRDQKGNKAKEKEKKNKKASEKPEDGKKSKGGRRFKGDKSKGSEKSKEEDGPALWPLIRQVVVKCKSTALSTGAILVDLPGVADANTARSSICQDYMKKADCVWILAPITRAVDDRTAKDLLGDAFKIQLKMDGNYDDSAITFVATKADDVSCSEVIRALKLEDDDELEAVEDKISGIKDDQRKWRSAKAVADKAVKNAEKELKDIRAIGAEYRQHLKALKNGESFRPTLTAKISKATPAKSLNPKKRKRTDLEEMDDAEDFDDSEDEIEDDSDLDSAGSRSGSDDEDGSDSDSDSDSSSASEEEGDAMDAEEEITEESLNAKIKETTETIKVLRQRLSNERAERKKAADEMTNAKDRLAKAQTEKNGICSTKRSEFSRDILKEDFRAGLREIDEADAQERDPDNFDPTQQIRNYEDIDLPTFCASARDYIRIKKQVKGDGNPTCFTNVDDTGIPALQDWCKSLTVSSRQRAARAFLTHLHTFTAGVRNYVEGINEVREEDRKVLREQWESVLEQEVEGGSDDSAMFDPFSWLHDDAWNEEGDGTYRAKKTTQSAKVDISGEPIGVTPRLTKEFEQVVDSAVEGLKSNFEGGLNEKLKTGAENAAAAALDTSDEFAASMHWQTYRATLRRQGSFRRCLNTELIGPLTRNIASSWAKVFESDLFASFEARATKLITKLLKDVENSSAAGLKDRARQQGEVALEEAKVSMKALVTVVREALNEQQKDISRCLVPHVQSQLRSGYVEAAEERGRGSVARQKAVFHNYIENSRQDVFTGGADTLLERLRHAADSIGDALDGALNDLSQKIEVSLSVLWESPRDDPRQVRARREAVEVLKSVDEQVALWIGAGALERSNK